MPVCGKKLSVCCSVLSVWGIIMLAIMGGLLRIKSVAFAEDFAATGDDALKTVDLHEVYAKYDEAAYNCWIACGLYGVTLVIAAHQFYLNSKAS